MARFVLRSAHLCGFGCRGGTRSGAEQPGDLGAEPAQVCRNHLDRGLGELEERQHRQVVDRSTPKSSKTTESWNPKFWRASMVSQPSAS